MDRTGFVALIDRLGAAWNDGDATGAAACFAEGVDYADPRRYHFGSRAELVPFFDPGPTGHVFVVHRLLFDETEQAGAIEYTYAGDHRYHGAAIVEVDRVGLISHWREWQHQEDERDWAMFLDPSDVDPPGR